MAETRAKTNEETMKKLTGRYQELQKVVTEITTRLAASGRNFQELQAEQKCFDQSLKTYMLESIAQQEAILSMLTKLAQSQLSTGVHQPKVTDPGQKSVSPGYHPSMRIDRSITAADMALILQQSVESGQKHYMETYFWRQQQARGDLSQPTSSAPVHSAPFLPFYTTYASLESGREVSANGTTDCTPEQLPILIDPDSEDRTLLLDLARQRLALDDPSSKLIGQFLHKQKASGDLSLDMDLEMDELCLDKTLPLVAESPVVRTSREIKVSFQPNNEANNNDMVRRRCRDLSDQEEHEGRQQQYRRMPPNVGDKDGGSYGGGSGNYGSRGHSGTGYGSSSGGNYIGNYGSNDNQSGGGNYGDNSYGSRATFGDSGGNQFSSGAGSGNTNSMDGNYNVAGGIGGPENSVGGNGGFGGNAQVGQGGSNQCGEQILEGKMDPGSPAVPIVNSSEVLIHKILNYKSIRKKLYSKPQLCIFLDGVKHNGQARKVFRTLLVLHILSEYNLLLFVVSPPTTLQLSRGLSVKNSPGSKLGTTMVCERMYVHGLPRIKYLGKIANTITVKVPARNLTASLLNLEVRFHRNMSIGIGMCPQGQWEKVIKSPWSWSMSPFNHKLLDLQTTSLSLESFEVFTEEAFFLCRIIFFTLGITLMSLAPSLSKSLVFYYGSAMGVGVLLVILIVLFQGMELVQNQNSSSSNRHCVGMSLMEGYPVVQVKQLQNPEVVSETIIGLVIRLVEHGLIHCDFNEFNIMIGDNEKVTMIDFPQMVSISHHNAQMNFDRDVDCIFKFFSKRFNLSFQQVVEDSDGDEMMDEESGRLCFSLISEDAGFLDKELAASGFTGKDQMHMETMQVFEVEIDCDSDSNVEEVKCRRAYDSVTVQIFILEGKDMLRGRTVMEEASMMGCRAGLPGRSAVNLDELKHK